LILHFVSFLTFVFYYFINWVNIQLNVFFFFIFLQITIYSDKSLADEMWLTFYKRTNWASREIISNKDYELIFFCHLNWSVVNSDQESKHEYMFFADGANACCAQMFCFRASLNNFPIYYDLVKDIKKWVKLLCK
jgi:hypothetical protein